MALAISASQVQVVSSDTVFANGRPYRLYHVDVPRLDAQCALERTRAAELQEFLQALVASAENVEVRPGFDPRGRQSWPNDLRGTRLARIAIEGRDLREILIEHGYAFRWTRSNQRNWCLPHP